MIEGKAEKARARRETVRRGLALSGSLFLSAWLLWLSASPVGSSPAVAGAPQADTTTSLSLPLPTTQPTTTSTAPPQTTSPPATPPPTQAPPPPEEEEAPVEEEEPEPEPEEEEEEAPVEEEEEVVEAAPDPTTGPITTSINLLRQGNGQPGSEEVAQAPPQDETVEAGSASDEDRVIWMIIVGLAAVALLVALLTWRYWLLTRPGLDLSDDDPDDGSDGGGGGGHFGGPPSPQDPYAAAGARRSSDVNPMTAGMPPAPSAGWQDPPRQGRSPEGPPRNDPYPPGGGGDPRPGRGGRDRRAGGDPFWEDGGEPGAGRGQQGPARRRQDPRSVRETDAWGRNPGS